MPASRWEITPAKTQLKRVQIENNEIWGSLSIRKALDVSIRNNRIVCEKDKPIGVEFCGQADVSGNEHWRSPAGKAK